MKTTDQVPLRRNAVAVPALREGESGERGVVFAKVIVGMDERAL